MLENFELNELSNIELLYRASSVEDPLVQELLSRIEFCVHTTLDNHSVLRESFKFADDIDNALEVLENTVKEDGQVFGYMPLGLFKAPRERAEFYWDGY